MYPKNRKCCWYLALRRLCVPTCHDRIAIGSDRTSQPRKSSLRRRMKRLKGSFGPWFGLILQWYVEVEMLDQSSNLTACRNYRGSNWFVALIDLKYDSCILQQCCCHMTSGWIEVPWYWSSEPMKVSYWIVKLPKFAQVRHEKHCTNEY